MKILQIASHYNQGGAAKIAACIHRQLLEDGVNSYVAYGRGPKSIEQNVFRFGTTPGVYYSALMSILSGISGWYNRLETGRLISYIKKLQPDLIHLHALHGYYLNLPMLFAYINKAKIPCVWTFHDCFAFTGKCGYFFECRKWQEGCGKCPNIGTYPKSLWFDFSGWMWKKKKEMFTAVDKMVIVSPSDWLTEEAKKSFVNKYPCVTVNNGIDVKNIFYPRNKEQCRAKYGYTQDEKLILGIAVGYKDVRKGAKYLIQLAKDLEKEAKVILIGWDKENDVMLEGTSNVITLPKTSSTEMLAEYYSLADVFVLPSLAENYATVTLEAMACGTPVVGFQAGGIPEQLTDGKGIAVEAANQKAFDEAVRRVLTEEDCVLRGNVLAAKIQEENSTEKMTQEYKKIYEQLLGH